MKLITNLAIPGAMNNEVKKSLIEILSKTSSSGQSIIIARHGKPVATVLPVNNCTEFRVRREEQLNASKTELANILALVRSRLKGQRLADLEAQLAAHRKKIEQENE